MEGRKIPMQLIDGKKISAEIKEEVKMRMAELKKQGRTGSLAVIQVGDDPASTVYVRNKAKACEYCGIGSITNHLSADISEEELLAMIESFNQDPQVIGILVQLPLPDHINENHIIDAISPEKDVDGFSEKSVGALCIGREGFRSCTPAGILELLRRSHIEIDGKNCVIVGRSNIVGKPMAMMMLHENATVTVTHTHTKNLKEICRQADILIVSVGKPHFITEDYVKEGAVVIDVGINRDADNHLQGDVDFDHVKEHTSYITPVPGGVGPMTIAMLMYNCAYAIEKRN